MPPDARGEIPDGTVTEVEFRLTDESYPFVAASEDGDCRVALEELVPQSSGEYLEFFSVRGAPAEDVLPTLEDCEGIDVRLLDAYDSGAIVQFRVDGACPAVTLADEGAVPRRLEAESGDAEIVADVLPSTRAKSVVSQFRDEHPDCEMVAKREREARAPLFVSRQLQSALETALTDRQREVLLTAYFGGYFEDPRQATGEELATRLGIAPSTFTEHLRNAEQELLSLVFDGRAGDHDVG